MREGVRLGRVAGIPVSLDWSLLVVFWLVTWGLADVALPESAPGYSAVAYWVVAAVTAVLFYGALLAHELAHAVLAKRHGLPVAGITLWLLGGVSRLGGEPDDARTELRIAVVGPATSLVVGATLLGLSLVTADGTLVDAVAGWLGFVNLVLGGFNLVPAYPLDGGRILRAYLWHRGGDRVRATRAAAHSGEVFARLLMILGVVEIVAGGIGGLWFVLLGWFLLGAARGESGEAELRTALTGVRVADVMSRDPVCVPADLTVDLLVHDWVLGRRHSAFPVVDGFGRLVGLVTLSAVRAVPAGARAGRTVGEIALPLEDVETAAPEDDVLGLARRLARSAGRRALVLDDGRLVGIVTAADITRALEVGTLVGKEHR